MLPPKQSKKYQEFYKAAKENDILDPKTTLLIHLSTSMAAGCYP